MPVLLPWSCSFVVVIVADAVAVPGATAKAGVFLELSVVAALILFPLPTHVYSCSCWTPGNRSRGLHSGADAETL